MAFYTSPLANVYEYDPADDGPEVRVINKILAKHVFYAPGKEGSLLRFQQFVDKVARHLYGERYGRLGKRRQENVRHEVIRLHLEDAEDSFVPSRRSFI